MTAKLINGPALIHVGERKPGDKTWATDEYILAPPGTIVAPRRRSEQPTPANAARAIVRQGVKLGMLPKGTSPDKLTEGDMGTSLPAFAAFQKAQAAAGEGGKGGVRFRPEGASTPRPAAPIGPPRYRRIFGAQEGAGAVNPVGDALSAIQQVAAKYGLDVPSAVAMLTGVPQEQANQGVQTEIPYAEGTGTMNQLLELLLGAAGVTGPDLMIAQLQIMNSLGKIDPRIIGVTDPAEVRRLLAEGQGMPTLESQKQAFNQSLFGFSQASPKRGNVPQVASS